MRPCTNMQMIEQIYNIFQNISMAITQAEEVLTKTEAIYSSVEVQVGRADLIKLEIAEIATQNQEIENNIQRFYLEIQNIHNNLLQKLTKIPDSPHLHYLHQELHSVVARLNEIHTKINQIDQNLVNFNQLTYQGVDSSQQLLSQVEEDKQLIIDLAQNLENRRQKVIKLQADLEQVLMMGDYLEKINTEISNLAIEVRNNREALQKMQNYIDSAGYRSDNSIWELRGEIESLQENFEYNYRDLKSKIQIQIKNQQRLDNWLFGIIFGIAFIIVTLFLGN